MVMVRDHDQKESSSFLLRRHYLFIISFLVMHFKRSDTTWLIKDAFLRGVFTPPEKMVVLTDAVSPNFLSLGRRKV